jgi:chemotaxis family two-component system sensor kinase Cph1
LTHVSEGASRFLAFVPPLGQLPAAPGFWGSETLQAAAAEMIASVAAGDPLPPLAVEARLGDADFDVVMHATSQHLVIEFEPREEPAAELATFALLAHRSLSRLKGQVDLDSALSHAVDTVRQLTGFDRVMAYRFRQDDSGEIVAEACSDELDPYLGRRFPASDIPVQARRLYTINTLRLIADVSDAQSMLIAAAPDAPPLDLSHSILRSVSPIHVEYLKNINVAASMSVSIVVGGKLWGLVACHHRTPLRVPYAVRMACDVLANVLSSIIQAIVDRSAQHRRSAANDLRSRLVELGLYGDDVSKGMEPSQAAIQRVVQSDRLLFSHGSEVRHAGIAQESAVALLRWLDAQGEDLVALDQLASLPPELKTALYPLSGLLAMRHDRVNAGWLVLLRNEQALTVTWSGPPDKVGRIGPLGSRLTPAGSLAEWMQEVRGCAEPWSELDLELARMIMTEVTRATASRAAEMDRARTHLLAILGHDLRDPLQSITIAAQMLQKGADQVHIGRRISASSDRMGRLISQVLDMSRLRGGMGLGLRLAHVDVSALLRELVDESSLAYPATRIELEMEDGVMADLDEIRFSQVVVNLIGNARQHGVIGEVVKVRLSGSSGKVHIEVMNAAPPLAAVLVNGLFDPLKRGSLPNQRNPHGLGLGLYIASEAIKGHQGTLAYSHDGRHVIFTVTVPAMQGDVAGVRAA